MGLLRHGESVSHQEQYLFACYLLDIHELVDHLCSSAPFLDRIPACAAQRRNL